MLPRQHTSKWCSNKIRIYKSKLNQKINQYKVPNQIPSPTWLYKLFTLKRDSAVEWELSCSEASYFQRGGFSWINPCGLSVCLCKRRLHDKIFGCGLEHFPVGRYLNLFVYSFFSLSACGKCLEVKIHMGLLHLSFRCLVKKWLSLTVN